MKGLANYTVKSLRANKVRTLVTVVGVALAAALVSLSRYRGRDPFCVHVPGALPV